MEYVEGRDLRDVLRDEGPLDPSRAVDLVGQAAEASTPRTRRGCVHRDVKPGNLLVSRREGAEHVYVCDFGLARHVSSVSSLTGDRGFVGTIDYVPPEQIAGGPIDGRADVYSLGCVSSSALPARAPSNARASSRSCSPHLNESAATALRLQA